MATYLAANLKHLRQVSKRTQDDVALALDVKRSSYSGYENGSAEPKLEILLRMQQYHNVGLDLLIGHSLCELDRFRLRTAIHNNPPRSLGTTDTL